MVQGFKEFILKGNLVEIAVAFIMASAFATVVTTFTAVLLGFIGKVGGQPDFSSVEAADVNVGLFLNALIAFLIVGPSSTSSWSRPTTRCSSGPRRRSRRPLTPDDVLLLQEIRDLLASRPQV